MPRTSRSWRGEGLEQKKREGKGERKKTNTEGIPVVTERGGGKKSTAKCCHPPSQQLQKKKQPKRGVFPNLWWKSKVSVGGKHLFLALTPTIAKQDLLGKETYIAPEREGSASNVPTHVVGQRHDTSSLLWEKEGKVYV